MGKTTDKVWRHWRPIGLINGKHHAACEYCGHKLQSNATRFKHHLVLCDHTPEHVKAEFRQTVTQQSLASTNQKRKLSVDIPENDTAHSSSSKSQRMAVTSYEIDSEGMDDTESSLVHSQIPSHSSDADSKQSCSVFRSFFDTVSSKEQAELDSLFAEACYTAGWSFNCVNNPFVKNFLQRIRPAWHSPSV